MNPKIRILNRKRLFNGLILSSISNRIAANGPEIKGVSVAEQVKAGSVSPLLGSVLSPAGRSEAWRGFCRQVASFLSFTSVAVQGLVRAGHLSPYTGLIESTGAVTVMYP